MPAWWKPQFLIGSESNHFTRSVIWMFIKHSICLFYLHASWYERTTSRSLMKIMILLLNIIMSAMASQITGLSIALLHRFFRRRSKKTSKLSVTGLCEGNLPVTDEFPAQSTIMRKMFPFDDVIMNFSDSFHKHHSILKHNVSYCTVPPPTAAHQALWHAHLATVTWSSHHEYCL